MCHCLLRRQPFLMVVPEQGPYKIHGLIAAQMLVFGSDELDPGFLLMPPDKPIELWVQFQIVVIQVLKELLSTKYFRNFYELIIIIVPMKEWLFSEYHARKHASETPHIRLKTIVGFLNNHFWCKESGATTKVREALPLTFVARKRHILAEAKVDDTNSLGNIN